MLCGRSAAGPLPSSLLGPDGVEQQVVGAEDVEAVGVLGERHRQAPVGVAQVGEVAFGDELGRAASGLTLCAMCASKLRASISMA